MSQRVALIIAAVGIAIAYGPHLAGDFVWDDVHLIANNVALEESGGLQRALSTDVWGMATGRSTQLYHPIPMAIYWAQTQLHGKWLAGYRAVNLLVHLAIVALFVMWVVRLGLPAVTSRIMGLTILLHPASVEPVMWITARQDSLGLLFVLVALVTLPVAGNGRLWSGLAAACAGVFAAFLCKESYIVAPALLSAYQILVSYQHRRAWDVRAWLCLIAPWVALALAIGVRLVVGVSLGASQVALPLATLAVNYASILVHYLFQWLSFDGGATIEPFRPLSPIAAAAAGLLFAGLTVPLVVLAWRRVRLGYAALIGWAWMLMWWAPHTMAVPANGLYGNRYGYFGALALALCLGALLSSLPAPPTPALGQSTFVRLAALAGLIMITALTGMQASHWRGNRSLFSADVQRDPHNGHALYHLGTAIFAQQGCQGALPIYIAATEHAPRYSRAWHNAAGCLIELGNPGAALAFAERELSLVPHSSRAHYNLGVALASVGNLKRAAAHLKRSLSLEPDYSAAQEALQQAERLRRSLRRQ